MIYLTRLIGLTLFMMALFSTVPSFAVEVRGTKPVYMPLGEPMLAPFSFARFCVRKPVRCPVSKQIHQIQLNAANRRVIEEVQRSVNSELRSGLERWDDGVTRTDCTDFALIKRSRLMDLGFQPSALLIAVAFVASGEAHLLLVVVTDRGDYVLDNLRPTMVRWDELPYRWVMRSTPQDPRNWQAVLPLYTGPGFESLARQCS